MQALVIHTKLINRKNPLDWIKFKVFNDLYLILKKLGFESDPGSYGSCSACSSCSSCSSCGGCGGGCGGCGGGCGGCGD